MNKKLYSSAIKKTPYNYFVSKKIASLILNKLDKNEVFEECYIKNLVGIESLERRREVTNVIYERLIKLDTFLLKAFMDFDVATSKFILVYAIAKNDQLFFEFLFEVYREALMGDKHYISIDDFDAFFEGKKISDLIVAGWGHYTIDQLAKGYRNILVESGLGKRIKRNIEVKKQIIHPDIKDHLKQIDDKDYIKAILGE